MAKTKKKRNSHVWKRAKNDHYVEPPWVSYRLFEDVDFRYSVVDPACGTGNIVRSARALGIKAQGYDIEDHGFGRRQDFFKMTRTVDNIASNPPFKVFERFARHALRLARLRVALIIPVARLNAARWLDGLPLETVLFITPRPGMPPKNAKKKGKGKTDYCWLVFRKGYKGPIKMGWLPRDKVGPGGS